MFHIDASTGDAVTCRKADCPRAQHYSTADDARAAFESMMHDFLFTTHRSAKATAAPAALDLNASFSQFKVSDAATAPAEDRGDWRGAITTRAERNGDVHADTHPDTSLPNIYADTSVEDDEVMPDLI